MIHIVKDDEMIKTEMFRLALENDLYVKEDTFHLQHELKDYVSGKSTAKYTRVCLAFDGEIPVGIALYDTCLFFSLQVFVKEDYRNKKIGSLLVKNLLDTLDAKERHSVRAGEGTEESAWLWCSMVEKNLLNPLNFCEYDVLKRQKESLFIKNFLMQAKKEQESVQV